MVTGLFWLQCVAFQTRASSRELFSPNEDLCVRVACRWSCRPPPVHRGLTLCVCVCVCVCVCCACSLFVVGLEKCGHNCEDIGNTVLPLSKKRLANRCVDMARLTRGAATPLTMLWRAQHEEPPCQEGWPQRFQRLPPSEARRMLFLRVCGSLVLPCTNPVLCDMSPGQVLVASR